jgi:hypothetical protein
MSNSIDEKKAKDKIRHKKYNAEQEKLAKEHEEIINEFLANIVN